MPTKVDREQLAVRLEKGVIAELHALARQYGYDSGNQVAAEIVLRYKEFWVAAKEAEAAVLEEQREVLLGKTSTATQPKSQPKKTRGQTD